jgi:hypothetical protein
MGVEVQPVRRVAIRPGDLIRSTISTGEPVGSLAEITVVGFAIGAVLAFAFGPVPEVAVVIAALIVLLMAGFEAFDNRRR